MMWKTTLKLSMLAATAIAINGCGLIPTLSTGNYIEYTNETKKYPFLDNRSAFICVTVDTNFNTMDPPAAYCVAKQTNGAFAYGLAYSRIAKKKDHFTLPTLFYRNEKGQQVWTGCGNYQSFYQGTSSENITCLADENDIKLKEFFLNAQKVDLILTEPGTEKKLIGYLDKENIGYINGLYKEMEPGASPKKIYPTRR